MKRLGLIVNPIAGLGGRVGLKGTDGVVREALELGAIPCAPQRAMDALQLLLPMKDMLEIVTCSGEMGESLAVQLGFRTKVIWCTENDATTSEDTVNAVSRMLEEQIELLLFAGGDGTARDITRAVQATQAAPGNGFVVVGIPAGVKIHSPVYAQSPVKAGELAKLYLQREVDSSIEAEVLDIDEDSYREGRVNTRLYGYLRIPSPLVAGKRYMQSRKAGSTLSEAAAQNSIAFDVIDNMESEVLYIIGPGTTTRAIMDKLNLPCTLIGVDLVLNRQLLALDVSEQQLLSKLRGRRAKLIVTPTGGQGCLLGRGNQQLSPAVLDLVGSTNLIAIATKQKLAELQGQPLYIDTGDTAADAMLRGYIKVVTGYRERLVYPVE